MAWASWLALLEPRAEYIAPLRVAVAESTRDAWFPRLALAVLEHTRPDHPEIVALADRCRAALDGESRSAQLSSSERVQPARTIG